MADSQLPALFSIVLLSGKPAAVADYLAQFNQAGRRDLTAGLRYGAGGVNELLQSKQRFYRSGLRQQVTAYDPFGAFSRIATDGAFRQPQLAMAVKWLFYLAGGFLLGLALHFARPAVSSLERPVQGRGFSFRPRLLFSSGFPL